MELSRKTAAFIVLAFSFLLYAPSVTGNFLWDDEDIVTGDAVLNDVSRAAYVFTPQYWQRDFPGSEGRYRPLRALTLMAGRKVWGDSAYGYHLENALLHTACALAVFWLSSMLGFGVLRGLFAALLFSAHPACVEAVAWVKNRTELLAALFSLLSFGLFLRSLEEGAGRRWRAGSLAAFCLALLGKESAAAFPLLPLTYLLTVRGERPLAALRRLWPYFALSALFLAFVLSLFRPGAMNALPSLKWAALNGSSYLRLLFLPYGLSLERTVVTAADLLGPLLFAGGCYYAYRKEGRAGLFFWAAALAALLPLLDVRLVISRPIAEQRLYLPAAFLALAGARLLPGLGAWREVSAGLLAVFTLLSLVRITQWRSPLGLWEGTVQASPFSARARLNLGLAYHRAGRLKDAATQYEASLALDPGAAQAKVNIAVLLAKVGAGDKGEKVYLEAIKEDPRNAQALLGLGNLLLARGDADGAELRATAALGAEPGNREALNLFGVARMVKGDLDGARAKFDAALALDPSDEKAIYNFAYLLRQKGDLAGAAAQLRRLTELYPGNFDAANNLAILEDMAGNTAEAEKILREVLERRNDYYQANYNLGLIYEAKGLKLEALAEFTRVLELNPGHEGARRKADALRKAVK